MWVSWSRQRNIERRVGGASLIIGGNDNLLLWRIKAKASKTFAASNS